MLRTLFPAVMAVLTLTAPAAQAVIVVSDFSAAPGGGGITSTTPLTFNDYEASGEVGGVLFKGLAAGGQFLLDPDTIGDLTLTFRLSDADAAAFGASELVVPVVIDLVFAGLSAGSGVTQDDLVLRIARGTTILPGFSFGPSVTLDPFELSSINNTTFTPAVDANGVFRGSIALLEVFSSPTSERFEIQTELLPAPTPVPAPPALALMAAALGALAALRRRC